jgi:putative ABC transport system substrate-binding protein
MTIAQSSGAPSPIPAGYKPGQGSGRSYRIGYLGVSAAPGSLHVQDSLFSSLCEFGYVEGENLTVERRFSEGEYDRLEALAHELASQDFDLVYVIGTQAAIAASRAIHKIPVVFASVAYPVAMGLVRSLWAPGTHRTGVANPSDVLCRKRIQLLKEIFPKARQVAVLHNSKNAVEALMLAAIEEACAKLKLSVALLEVESERDFAGPFEVLENVHPDLLYVIESPLNFMHRSQIVKQVSERRLAAIYGFSEFADAGGLMSYSFSLAELVRASATYIHKIFMGEKASQLPVQVPAKFELVVNQNTAKALGIKIPQSVLIRADRVIE